MTAPARSTPRSRASAWSRAAGRTLSVAVGPPGRRPTESSLSRLRGHHGAEAAPGGAPRSRARIVEAGDDAERRRLERNLHDGAQQRLVSSRSRCGSPRRSSAATPRRRRDPRARRRRSSRRARGAARARARHPSRRPHRPGPRGGARGARRARAVPVESRRPDGAPAGPVEAAAYYVVSEALTNVAKYAGAHRTRASASTCERRARRRGRRRRRRRRGPAGGTGLRGLADRVEALDGRSSSRARPAAAPGSLAFPLQTDQTPVGPVRTPRAPARRIGAEARPVVGV